MPRGVARVVPLGNATALTASISPLDEERGDGAGQEQRQPAVGGVIRDAVVGVGEVPQVVGDDPGPDHVGPDHVARRILGDDDAEPPADGEDVEDAGDAVHDVPRPRYGPEVLDHAALPQREAEHLEVARHGLGDVDGQDQRREAQRPLLLVEVMDLAIRARPLDEAQRDEPEAPGQGRVGLDPVEPRARAVLVARRGGGGPHEHGERERHRREQDDSAPELHAPELVERHEREQDEQPDGPVDGIGCLVEDAPRYPFNGLNPLLRAGMQLAARSCVDRFACSLANARIATFRKGL